MTDTLPIAVTVRWYSSEEGGRRSGPPPGPRYTPTGRFAGQPVEDMFSVILELSTEARGTVCPAFPENLPDLGERLSRGETLFLHEGRPVVAEVVAR